MNLPVTTREPDESWFGMHKLDPKSEFCLECGLAAMSIVKIPVRECISQEKTVMQIPDHLARILHGKRQ